MLTAGFGNRLRPLTQFLPKPLLPVRGRPTVGYSLEQLGDLGCEAAALNLHYLGSEILRELGRSYFGLPLRYSEESEIQGTGGALFPLRHFLRDADLVLLVNGDSLCRWPWKAMIRRHLKTGADVTLLLHKRRPEANFGGGIGVDERGRVVKMRAAEPVGTVARQHLFAGAHILSPKLLDHLVEGPGDIIEDLYLPLLESGGHIDSVVTRRQWFDLGTPARYLEAVLGWGAGGPLGRKPGSWTSPLAKIGDDTTIRRSVIEAEAGIGNGVEITDSVILNGARIAEGSRIENSLVGPNVVLPKASSIDRRMVCVHKSGYQPGAGESVLGDLVYSPFDP